MISKTIGYNGLTHIFRHTHVNKNRFNHCFPVDVPLNQSNEWWIFLDLYWRLFFCGAVAPRNRRSALMSACIRSPRADSTTDPFTVLLYLVPHGSHQCQPHKNVSINIAAPIRLWEMERDSEIDHGSLNVPFFNIFHITQPLGIWSINVYNGYYFWWCPIFPSHGTFTNPCWWLHVQPIMFHDIRCLWSGVKLTPTGHIQKERPES